MNTADVHSALSNAKEQILHLEGLLQKRSGPDKPLPSSIDALSLIDRVLAELTESQTQSHENNN